MRGDQILRQPAPGRGNRPGRQYSPGLPIGIPKQGAADGVYKIARMEESMVSANRHYEGNDLSGLAPVTITNHEQLTFSDIKKIESKLCGEA